MSQINSQYADDDDDDDDDNTIMMIMLEKHHWYLRAYNGYYRAACNADAVL